MFIHWITLAVFPWKQIRQLATASIVGWRISIFAYVTPAWVTWLNWSATSFDCLWTQVWSQSIFSMKAKFHLWNRFPFTTQRIFSPMLHKQHDKRISKAIVAIACGFYCAISWSPLWVISRKPGKTVMLFTLRSSQSYAPTRRESRWYSICCVVKGSA